MTKRRTAILWFCLLVLFGAAILSFSFGWQHRSQIYNWFHHFQKTVVVTPGYYRVTEAVDGDTIAIDMAGVTEKVRFIGVDTPETHKPNTPVQCYGEEAAAFTKSLISDKTVRLEDDPKDQDRDIYGRLLRYVYLSDGTFVNKKLVESGYGFAYTLFPFSRKSEFVSAENTAKSQKVGLWAACNVTRQGEKYQTEYKK